MLIFNKREKMFNESNNILISNLKGRVSKVLGTRVKLTAEERSGLEGIYEAIDSLILSKKDVTAVETFKAQLKLHTKFIEETSKSYIKEHIIPLINKVRTRKWGKDE